MRVATFLATPRATLVAQLAADDARRFRGNEPQQMRAWDEQLAVLQSALADWPEAAGWELVLEYEMRRLGRRIDVVLLTPRAILVLEFKVGATLFTADDRRQVEDYALDLHDFHPESRAHPIIPILVATHASPRPTPWPLFLAGEVTPPLDASATTLADLLRDLHARLPAQATALDLDSWEVAPYRPVPGIVDAARTLYGRHGVTDIAHARAEARTLTATTQAILDRIAQARRIGGHHALFVTGIPGAGKTLVGLNTVFGAGRDAGAVFLTGNPTLVHVLREALARDDAAGGLRAARQKMSAAIQALPDFRDENVTRPEPPHDHVIVIDEGQRAWSADYAIRKSAARKVQLSDSEPGHLLDIMARHPDWAVVVCLVGGGQEIHDGEGGLAEWGQALATRPDWSIHASPDVLTAPDPRQRLAASLPLQPDANLHLDVPMRSLRNPHAAAWVDALIADDIPRAARIAADAPLPFRLTRDLAALRAALRAATRGERRAGLVASSGAKRLRGEGLGVELPHMDADAVAHWFLDHWPPDIRASGALEVVATEFSCQGLELDAVGLCWGGDLICGRHGWVVRRLAGADWQVMRTTEKIANRLNTYRVLLTRARYETIIWVPRGDPADHTRDPSELDAVAEHLRRCGVPDLVPTPTPPPRPAQAALF